MAGSTTSRWSSRRPWRGMFQYRRSCLGYANEPTKVMGYEHHRVCECVDYRRGKARTTQKISSPRGLWLIWWSTMEQPSGSSLAGPVERCAMVWCLGCQISRFLLRAFSITLTRSNLAVVNRGSLIWLRPVGSRRFVRLNSCWNLCRLCLDLYVC
jgi:hypothetical protein